MSLNFYLVIVFTLIAFYHDVRYQKIPNWLTGSGVVIGFLVAILSYGFVNGMIFSGLGLAISTVILLLLYLIKGLGAGDVKLFSAIGAITGIEFSLYSLMYSILFAGAIAVVLLLYRISFIKNALASLIAFIISKVKKEPQAKEA